MTESIDKRTWIGLAGAPGRAAGAACILRGGADLVPPAGCILVARILHPHLAPLLFRSSGVVVEEAALLQHATTLAREFGIPAVLGLRHAPELFQDGDWLEIDGETGRVVRLDPPSRDVTTFP
jgi:pyruvate,water dikinase